MIMLAVCGTASPFGTPVIRHHFVMNAANVRRSSSEIPFFNVRRTGWSSWGCGERIQISITFLCGGEQLDEYIRYKNGYGEKCMLLMVAIASNNSHCYWGWCRKLKKKMHSKQTEKTHTQSRRQTSSM